MAKELKSLPLSGIILIVLGITLLLYQTRVIDVRFSQLLWSGLTILGCFITVQGFIKNRNGKIFWGTALFLTSVYFLLNSLRWIYIYHDMFFPAFLLIFGFAFLMVYVNNLKEFVPLIIGVALIAIGGAFILAQNDYLNWWEVRYIIKNFWPVILILLGLAILFKSRSKK